MRKRLGNITQLQDLLFGDRAKEYDRKLKQYERRINFLEENSQKLESSLMEGLEELETKLTHQINLVANSLEKKVRYLDLVNKEERQKTKQEIDRITQQASDNLSYLQDNIKNQNNNLKTEINAAKTELEREIKSIRQQINNKLDSSLAELSTGKVSRSDLAEVLFELCLKLKDPETELELPENRVIQTHADLILPEEKSTLTN